MVVVKGALMWLLGLACLLVGAYALQQRHERQGTDAAWELARKVQIQLNDSTVTRFAAQKRDNDSLRAIAQAAHGVGGKLVSGFTVVVERHDTIVVHDTLVTKLSVDSTRTANFRDSTFAGIVSGVVIAPRCCAALGLTLKVDRPEFHPQVGFMQVGDQLAAIVSWQGEKVRIENAFSLPTPPVPRRIVPWMEGTYNLASSPELGAGIGLRVFGAQIGPSLHQELAIGATPRVGFTVRREW
jgi:hypothetical protein